MSAQTFSEILELERIFNAPIEKVFSAWTKPEILAKWFGPDGFSVKDLSIDLRTNGHYSITIETPEKKEICHFGQYLKIDRPNTLIFTWELENQECQGSLAQNATTIVELNFFDQRNSTLLKLKHEKLPNKTALNGHRYGWESSLDCLGALFRS